ncbi:MAG: hypothetical protein M0017_10635 [Desulfobacteraceae bacterium]|nr:hypothetical protein [Desulfobacteraceae bacterium]
MKRVASAFFFLTAALCAAALPAWGREVVLGAGESYSADDLTVRCVERAEPQVIKLTDCQFWDQFEQKCLYERKTYRYGRLACVEECQHWDSFSNTCFFATTCEFVPGQHAFVRTSCDVFDQTENVCRRTKQQVIGDAHR